jgi:hypothetical protein
MSRRLSKYEQRQVASLIEDGGYSYRHAREMVLAGFGEPLPDEFDPDESDEDRELAEGEARAQAQEDRDRDDTFIPDAEAAE